MSNRILLLEVKEQKWQVSRIDDQPILVECSYQPYIISFWRKLDSDNIEDDVDELDDSKPL